MVKSLNSIVVDIIQEFGQGPLPLYPGVLAKELTFNIYKYKYKY